MVTRCYFRLLACLLLFLTTFTLKAKGDPYLDIYPTAEPQNESTPLYFGLMLSLSGDQQSTGALAGVQAALDHINSRDDLLPGYSLHYTLTDSKCNRTTALYGLFTQLNQQPQPKVALIGSGCSSATAVTAEHAHFHNNIIQISCTTSSGEMSDRVRFPYYFQLLPSEVNLARVFYSIIKEYGWRRMALIVQNEYRDRSTMHRLMEMLSKAKVNYTETNFDDKRDLKQLIHPYGTQARIYVFAMDTTSTRYLFCEAHRLNMRYPKYMFLTYGFYEREWWKEGDNVDERCTPEDVASVLHYSLAATHFYKSSRRNDTFYPLCYDATFTLAFALNKTIEESAEMGNSSVNYFTVKSSHMQGTNFTGISGQVRFDDQGIRDVTELKVLQYRTTYLNGTPIIKEGSIHSTLTEIEVAYLSDKDNLLFLVSHKQGIWPNLTPYDGIPKTKIMTIMLPVTVILSALNIFGVACAIFCLIFNIIYRKRRMIRLNSPKLNYVMIIGVIIVYLGCIVFVIPTHNPKTVSALCILRVWLLSIGHSLGFGTVIAKLLRIYYIFKNFKQNPGTRKKGIHDWHLFLFVLGLVLVDVTILTIYTVLEGVVANFTAGIDKNKEKSMSSEGELEIKIEYFIYTCSKTKWILFSTVSVLSLYKGVLQVCALAFAFQTRKVKIEGLNDAKYITAFVYTTSIIVGMTFISSLALSEYINIHSVVYSFGVWLAISAILGFMFVPKMVSLYKDPDGDKVFEAHDRALLAETLTNSMREFKGSGTGVDVIQQRNRHLEDELTSSTVDRVPDSFSHHSYRQCKQ